MIEAFKDLWRRFWWRLSDWAEQLSVWLHPGFRVPALTTRRVERFHAFWKDLGFAEAHDSATGRGENGQPGTAVEDGPMGLAEAADALEDENGKISEEAAETIRKRFVEAGRLTELNTILFEVSEERAAEIPTKLVEAVLADFIIAYVKHKAALLGARSATTSSSKATKA
jgi:hypothetical protein